MLCFVLLMLMLMLFLLFLGRKEVENVEERQGGAHNCIYALPGVAAP